MKKLSGFIIILLLSFSIHAKTVNLTDFGANINDGQNDAPALQSAINDLLQSGGGTIIFPAGKIELQSAVGTGSTASYVNLRLLGDKGSEVAINADANTIIFNFGNLNQVLFENLIFTGKTSDMAGAFYTDADKLIQSNYVSKTVIRDCQFYGLGFNTALVHALGTDLLIENSQIEGSRGNVGLVFAENNRGLIIRNSNFIDYANYKDRFLTKTFPVAGPWVKVRQEVQLNGNAMTAYPVTIDQVRFDEGSCVSVDVDNVAFVKVEGSNFNIYKQAGCMGIKLNRVTYAQITQSSFGFSIIDNPLLRVTNSGNVEAKGITLGNAVKSIEKDQSSNVSVQFCPDCRIKRIN